MDSALHDLLVCCDVRGAWESPPGADWRRSVDEVRRLQPRLEEALGIDLRLDDGVQDASFFADLGQLVQQNYPNGVIALSYEICFRFSWFSRLYTIHGNAWERLMNERALAVADAAGFVYVPEVALHLPYDGVNEPFEPGLTWWTRYFDYL